MNDIKIVTYKIPQIVSIRKYDVDIEALKILLKTSKQKSGLSNKNIADNLVLPLTKVEHWFRSDKCFSIPDPEHWLDLKRLLSIDTDIFDLSILTFDNRLGVYDKTNRVYGINGLAPTLTSTDADIKILIEEVVDD